MCYLKFNRQGKQAKKGSVLSLVCCIMHGLATSEIVDMAANFEPIFFPHLQASLLVSLIMDQSSS